HSSPAAFPTVLSIPVLSPLVSLLCLLLPSSFSAIDGQIAARGRPHIQRQRKFPRKGSCRRVSNEARSCCRVTSGCCDEGAIACEERGCGDRRCAWHCRA